MSVWLLITNPLQPLELLTFQSYCLIKFEHNQLPKSNKSPILDKTRLDQRSIRGLEGLILKAQQRPPRPIDTQSGFRPKIFWTVTALVAFLEQKSCTQFYSMATRKGCLGSNLKAMTQHISSEDVDASVSTKTVSRQLIFSPAKIIFGTKNIIPPKKWKPGKRRWPPCTCCLLFN